MKILITRILQAALVAAAFLSAQSHAQGVFLKYGPQPGIQFSTGLDYHNTAATSANVLSTLGSQTANTILAAPNGAPGNSTFRALVGADIPAINLATSGNGGVSGILLGTSGGTSNGFFSVTGPTTALRTFTFPNASATVLTTNAAVTVPQGGTGLATLTANGVLLGEGTSNVSPLVMGADTVLRGTASADPVAAAIPNCGSGTTALNYSTSTHSFGCQTITSGGTGTVTNVATGTGLTGGPITSTGTVALDLTANNAWTGAQTWTQTNAGSYNSIFQNASTGAAAVTRLDLKNSTESLVLANTSTAFSGAFMTGGSTGESANIQTNGAIPINLGVGGAARISFNNAVSGRQVDIVTNGNTSTGVGYVGFVDQAGARYGYFGKSSSGTTVSYESDAAVQLVGNNGSDIIAIDGSHNVSVGGSIASMAVSAPVISTVFRTVSGAASIGSASATTVATLPNTGTGTYFVSCAVSGGSGTSQSVAGFVFTNGTNATLTALGSTSGSIAVTMSGLNLQCTQNIGGTQSVSWSYFRWGS